jgi:hypothetical protein
MNLSLSFLDFNKNGEPNYISAHLFQAFFISGNRFMGALTVSKVIGTVYPQMLALTFSTTPFALNSM